MHAPTHAATQRAPLMSQFANGGVSIRFRREIKPFAKFRVITRLCSYEERTFGTRGVDG